MLKKSAFLSTTILVSVILFLTAPLLKASSESAETSEEILYDNNSVPAYYNLLGISELAANPLYQTWDNRTFLKEVVSYLAQREKSPPISAT